MPLQFVYTDQEFVTDVCRSSGPSSRTSPVPAKFDTLLQTGWTKRMEAGLFRYTLGALQTHIMPGSHNYVAQLNVQRGSEKRKPQEILSIRQEFNPRQFNFNKINPEEVIFEMVKVTERHPDLHNGEEAPQPSRMTVLVNVSPLEFGHCLLVPDPLSCLPQILTPFTIQVGIESVLLSSDTGFRVGFNSLGAFASVNHLHLHGYYMGRELKIESRQAEPLVPEKGFYRFLDFPVGFLFYTESEQVEEVSRAVCEVTDLLVAANVAHNLFMTRGCPPHDGMQDKDDLSLRRGVRIIVWPRLSCFGVKEDSAFNVALCELAGHLPFKNKRDFECYTEKDVSDIIQKYLLPDDEMKALEQQLVLLLKDS
ncbi:GDP-D-glucose phosphorylase 1 [Cynoglossus semilaevis]|uniref:GDP-D-glucose phosphorylase 1 n=1 Tax=Cynoglossus semilaevis TaxID=244447 RepID=A0A3P8W5Y8_CYNSE|nr:GDP-D-glucose phosphorylase 1 [Cynoglossus semilaevis]XP_008310756.1 GDP-D-glucose phosphorylase 1 [Cynoglossus semilaevis]